MKIKNIQNHQPGNYIHGKIFEFPLERLMMYGKNIFLVKRHNYHKMFFCIYSSLCCFWKNCILENDWKKSSSPTVFFSFTNPKRSTSNAKKSPVDLLTPDGGTKVVAWNATSVKNTCPRFWWGSLGVSVFFSPRKKERPEMFHEIPGCFSWGILMTYSVFSYPNWVVVHPLYTLNNQGFFHYCSNNFTRNVKVQKYCSWFGKGKLGGVLMIKCCKRSFHRKTWTFQWTKHFNRSFGFKTNDFHFDCSSLAPPKKQGTPRPSILQQSVFWWTPGSVG